MQRHHGVRSPGLVLLCCGVGLLAAGLGTHQPVMLSAATPLLALGIVFLARSRRAG